MSTNTTHRDLPGIKREAKRLLRKYEDASPEARTPILRTLASLLVDAREHFERPDGSPDWKGRSYPYRVFVRDIYSDAGFSKDEQATVQAATRYHIGAVLRERLDDETLDEYGLAPSSPREKSQERRENRSALLNALTAREVGGGALLAISTAYTVLSRLDADALAGLDDRERKVAVATLRDLARRVEQLEGVARRA